MFDTNQNPLPINRIELNRSQSGHNVVNLYGGILDKPLLVIPEMHFELLTRAGINPNELKFGEFNHVTILAHWQEAAFRAPSGKAYRDVTQLINDDPEKAAEHAHRQEVKQLLEQIIIRLDILCQGHMISEHSDHSRLLN